MTMIGRSFFLLAVVLVSVDKAYASSATAPSATINGLESELKISHEGANGVYLKQLTYETLNEGVKKMEYAVRGRVVVQADSIAKELQDESSKSNYPFDHIVYTNIGNPHSVGQQPLTWPRQVLALVDLPDAVGLDNPRVHDFFPADAIQRARSIKKALNGHGSGAYTHSKGVPALRQDVADFLEQRDGGIAADPECIYLTNGASAGIQVILNTILSHKEAGVMIPVPQYPIYSATIDLMGGKKVGYYLEEAQGWALNMLELERSLFEARQQGTDVRAIVVINPGNPSGAVLSPQNLQDICKFCVKHRLILMADEVYQENVYEGEFRSCKRAAYDAGVLDDIELVSFHSVSKGVFGECGRRGGFMELVNFEDRVQDEIYKMASACLCSTVPGQVMTSLMVKGPKPGDVSYDLHESEKKAIYNSLKNKAQRLSNALNSDDMPGFSCQPAQGAMYCFPAVKMPAGAIKRAQLDGVSPDTLYCIDLLKHTGICVVPASGFAQAKGRYGFRTTFLPSEDEIERVIGLLQSHYTKFCQEYAN